MRLRRAEMGLQRLRQSRYWLDGLDLARHDLTHGMPLEGVDPVFAVDMVPAAGDLFGQIERGITSTVNP